MNPFNQAPRVAFQPPSDMVNGGGSSTTKKVFVGLGIGCGLVLILLGLMLSAGAFKAVTCCNDVKKIADSSVGAQQFAGEFATELAEGKHDEAYARTSSAFQSAMSKDAFTGAVEAHREQMKASKPRLQGMDLQQSGGDKPSMEQLAKGSWLMSFQFAGPQDSTMLLLNFRVASAPEGAERAFEIDDVTFDERPRNLSYEPPAEEVLKVHDLIQRSQYEAAYNRLGDQFRSTADNAAWRAFLKDAGEVLTASDLQIREVAYNDANTQATVMAHAKSTSGKDAIVQFELQSQMPGLGWRIVTIAPLIAESNNAPIDPSAPSGETHAGATTGTAAPEAVAPPAVDVKISP